MLNSSSSRHSQEKYNLCPIKDMYKNAHNNLFFGNGPKLETTQISVHR